MNASPHSVATSDTDSALWHSLRKRGLQFVPEVGVGSDEGTENKWRTTTEVLSGLTMAEIDPFTAQLLRLSFAVDRVGVHFAGPEVLARILWSPTLDCLWVPLANEVAEGTRKGRFYGDCFSAIAQMVEPLTTADYALSFMVMRLSMSGLPVREASRIARAVIRNEGPLEPIEKALPGAKILGPLQPFSKRRGCFFQKLRGFGSFQIRKSSWWSGRENATSWPKRYRALNTGSPTTG